MKRTASWWMLSGWCLCTSIGCAHLVETRTISAFTESLQKADLEHLKQLSSDDFQETVLRRDDALEAMKQLNLPSGEAKVLDVKEVSANERKVTVEVGEKKRKVVFRLTRDGRSNKWVVNDLELKRRLKPGQVSQTVSEQMDLLLSVRECLAAWETGDREQVLHVATPEFRGVLESLPPACLEKLTKEVAGDMKVQSGLRPEIEGHQDTAVVRMNRSGGEMYLTLHRVDEVWKVDDAHVQSKKNGAHVPSIRKLSAAIMAGVAFDEAYRAGDAKGLAEAATEKFYKECLASADLTLAPLSEVLLRDGQFDVKLQSPKATLIVHRGDEYVEFALVETTAATEAKQDLNATFRVEEVTFHAARGDAEKRLSAMLTAPAVMQVFAEALAARDLKMLRLGATQDFNERVWEQLNFATMPEMPLERIGRESPEVQDVAYKGPITEITVLQGRTPMTYVVRDQAGVLLVDDVLLPALDLPSSLKATLELMVPIRTFSAGFQTKQLKLLKDSASTDFKRIVLNHLQSVPTIANAPYGYLKSPLSKVTLAPDRAIVVLGDERWGAKVFLLKEGNRYVVDDVSLVNGIEQNQRVGLKQQLRAQYAYGGSDDATAPVPELR